MLRTLLLLAGLWLTGLGPASAASAPNTADAAATAPVSDTARRLYDAARPRLFQIRVLLKQQANQASAGSGFVVAPDGLLVTNYHVVAQLALEPDKYRAVASGPDGGDRALTLLAIDVRHDLAVLRLDDGKPPAARFDWAPVAPRQGDRLYSLGNPLDIGFAVVEGTFNGTPPRAFYPQMLFTGAINPGMSGGPVLDAAGRVVGINVSKHLGGELVSFLVPAEFARALAAGAHADKPLALPAHAEVTRQLLQHQKILVERTLAHPLRQQTHGHWRVPLLDETWARCWGDSETLPRDALRIERTNCSMDTMLYTGLGLTGALAVRYEIYDGKKLGAWRFHRVYSESFANEDFSASSTRETPLRCHEGFVSVKRLPLRGVVCARAHRKFPGLYDFSVLAVTLDATDAGVLGRLDATGMSFDNGMALARHFLGGFDRVPPAKQPPRRAGKAEGA